MKMKINFVSFAVGFNTINNLVQTEVVLRFVNIIPLVKRTEQRALISLPLSLLTRTKKNRAHKIEASEEPQNVNPFFEKMRKKKK